MGGSRAAVSLTWIILCVDIRRAAQETAFARYDPSFGSLRCPYPAVKCETGTSEYSGGSLDGVGSFERNSPNTIDGCPDLSDAVYEEDEYITKLQIRNVEGLDMTGGQTARITARVTTAVNASGREFPDEEEVAHFFYASNAATGNWEYLTTKTRTPGRGEAIIHHTVRLSIDGGIQAIRVNYGYGINHIKQPCASDAVSDGSSFIDVDDLVFAVYPAPPPTRSPTASPTSQPSLSNEPTISNNPTVSGYPTFMVNSIGPSSEPSSEQTLLPNELNRSEAPTPAGTILDDDEFSIIDWLLPFLSNASSTKDCDLLGLGIFLSLMRAFL